MGKHASNPRVEELIAAAEAAAQGDRGHDALALLGEALPEDPESFLPWRFYRGLRTRRVILLVAGYAIAGSVIAVATAKSLSVGDIVALAGIGGVCLGYVLYNAFRLGVKESAEGLSWFLYLARTRIAWEQIRKVDVIRIGVSRVVIIRCDGRRDSVAPLTQGRRVVWRGGSTDDIASVLGDRVNQVRASRGLAPVEKRTSAP